MNFNIVTEYPFWFVFLCILTGLIYASILYYREKKNEFSRVLKNTLFVVRFILVFILCFLLLSPMTKRLQKEVEEPLILFAIDNSESIILNSDSSEIMQKTLPSIYNLMQDLNSNYEVRAYTFGEQTENVDFIDQKDTAVDFQHKQTDMQDLLEEIKTRYYDRNVGALVVMSDGIYTKGRNPVYGFNDLNYPVYALAMGDTHIYRDLSVPKLNYNRISYLGNKFPLRVIVDAKKAKNTASMVEVLRNGKKIASQNIRIAANKEVIYVDFSIEAKTTGIQKYEVRVLPVDGEKNLLNNAAEMYIDILDNRQKILLISYAPHPDISAIKQCLQSVSSFEVEEILWRDYDGNPEEYNMIVLHQLPANGVSVKNWVKNARESDVAMLYILGGKSDILALNNLRTGFTINYKKLRFEESQAVMNDNFTLFTISEDTRELIKRFPPLNVPFGNYSMNASAQVLFRQKIGYVETQLPLISFFKHADYKSAVVCGDGLWKWRIRNYQENANFDAFDEIILKSMQYLSLKTDKSLFRVYSKNSFSENQAMEFEAEVYNDSYELVTDAEVKMNLTNQTGKEYRYAFVASEDRYFLNAGVFPPGEYNYEATTVHAGKNYTEKGEISVTSIQDESINTIADHDLMYRISAANNGKLFYPDQLNDLKEELLNRQDISSVAYYHKKYSDWINILPLMFMLLVLLSFEWFARKRAGAY